MALGMPKAEGGGHLQAMWAQLPCHGFEQGGLSGTRRPQNEGRPARLDDAAHAVEDCHLYPPHTQDVELQECPLQGRNFVR